jgi:hypothetical protein
MIIKTTFTEIQCLEVSQKGDLLIAVSKLGNKQHIYSLLDFELKHCIFLGNNGLRLMNITFNKKSKLLAMLPTDLNLSIFNLKQHENTLCECDDFDDEEVIINEEETQPVTKKESFFGSFFSKISKTIFNDYIDTFASMKVSPTNTNVGELLKFLLSFDSYSKGEMVLIENNGIVKRLKFDSKEGGTIELINIMKLAEK